MSKIDQIYQKCFNFWKLAIELDDRSTNKRPTFDEHIYMAPLPNNPLPIDVSEKGIDSTRTRTVRPGRKHLLPPPAPGDTIHDDTIPAESENIPRIVLDDEGKFHLKNNPQLLDENDDFKYSNQDIVDAILEAQRNL